MKILKPVSYSVTKHGLIGMTKYFATLWSDKGIRINALSPGAIENNQDITFKNKDGINDYPLERAVMFLKKKIRR